MLWVPRVASGPAKAVGTLLLLWSAGKGPAPGVPQPRLLHLFQETESEQQLQGVEKADRKEALQRGLGLCSHSGPLRQEDCMLEPSLGYLVT